jgi:hypothetical protein
MGANAALTLCHPHLGFLLLWQLGDKGMLQVSCGILVFFSYQHLPFEFVLRGCLAPRGLQLLLPADVTAAERQQAHYAT